jgi:serine phosphatase RsbU (regulator of sigma subunit)
MSILGALILDKIILNFDKTPKASEILNQMRLEVKYLLQQNVDKIAVKDGMDMSLIIINYDTMQMQFAGAQNNIYLIRHNKGTYDDKIEEHKGDHMPIGIYVKEKESFTNHIISINKNDLVYLFSDGYYDQFGGKESKKFKKINFKKTLLKGAPLPLDEQKNNLEQTINKWQGDYEQIDDITVIGLKI